MTHESSHDECAAGLNDNVGDDAGGSGIRGEADIHDAMRVVLPLKEPVPLIEGSDVDHPPSSEKEVDDSLLKDHVDVGMPSSFKELPEGVATKSSRRPIILELCAGSARLSAACASDGFTSISVDYEGNRHKSWHHVLELDLRLPSSWDTLRKIVVMHDVVFVHIAPPCGTSSRARERPMSAGEWGPPPLRSSSHPWGLPFLSPKDRRRVEQANILYRHIAEFCRFLSNRNIKWSIENPRRSYLWELGPFIELLDVATFYDFDACMLEGTRDKRTSFLSSLDMSDICLDCDGGHDHAAWGIQEDGTFATAQEAEYPSLLCQTISIRLYLDMLFLWDIQWAVFLTAYKVSQRQIQQCKCNPGRLCRRSCPSSHGLLKWMAQMQSLNLTTRIAC